MSRMRVALIIPAVGEESLAAAMAALVALDYLYLATHPDAPLLYQSGVVYRPEPRGSENWLTVPDLLRLGYGDCEDLASWRCAELRLEGEHAVPCVRRSGRRTYHAMVCREDGSIEDPSRVLGLRRRA
jgi:hypothetical protein